MGGVYSTSFLGGIGWLAIRVLLEFSTRRRLLTLKELLTHLVEAAVILLSLAALAGMAAEGARAYEDSQVGALACVGGGAAVGYALGFGRGGDHARQEFIRARESPRP